MDALDLLSADHNRLRGLFGRFEDAQHEDDTAEQAALAARIVDELEIHTTVEEAIFYPMVRDLSATIDASVDKGVEEHRLARAVMRELRASVAGSDEWVAKTRLLMEVAQHHADEEERELFPRVRSATDPARREVVAELIDARKAELGAYSTAALRPADSRRAGFRRAGLRRECRPRS